jgi:3-deoxy-D-manno-octulosonate 8-phosphate phosphatase (KDO 8-P phosphatase)
MDPDLSRRAAGIECVLTDVDGVLTDGTITLLGDTEELKQFHVWDGSGIKYAQRAGLRIGFVTGRRSDAVARRAAELGVEDLHMGAIRKLPVLEAIQSRHGLQLPQIAYIGDDLIDLPILTRVGLAAAVPQAHEEVLSRVHYVTAAAAGRGALRELIEIILKARGDWDSIMERYLK